MSVPTLVFLLAHVGTGMPTGFDEATLAGEVWQHAPAVLSVRQGLADAEADRARSYLLPNPTLSAGWNTIPIGSITQSEGTHVGFLDVPNYNVGVGQLFELGKRGPRQHAAEAARRAAAWSVMDAYRETFFAVMEAMVDQATAVARAAVLERLVQSSSESLSLQRARAEKGDVAVLEVDRLEVEHSRLRTLLQDADAAQESAALDCAQLLARECPRLATEEAALAFLQQEGLTPAGGVQDNIELRPDLQALRADRERLESELTLADRLKIPDPTLGLGYTHDQFIASGNQGNSLNLTLSLPLPLFDRGQPEIARNQTRLQFNQEATESLSVTARKSIDLARRQLAILDQKVRILDREALPLARTVLERMEAAASRGGVALPEVLLARRQYQDAQLSRVEVTASASRAALELRRAAALYPPPPGPTPAPVR